MPEVAFLVSSAPQLTLEDGSTRPAFFFTGAEILAPYEQFVSAGATVTVVTPDGKPPRVETRGPSWFFDSTDDDSRYLASVVGTFARNVEDIDVTLHQYADLGLTMVRRVDGMLRARGRTATEAHQVVSTAARMTWRENRPLAHVLAEDESLGLTRADLRSAASGQRADSQKLAALQKAKLQEISDLQDPVALSSLTVADMQRFDALFVAGGHGAMTDLASSPHVGRMLVALHRGGVPIAALGHGAAALLSAGERADGLWLYDGYRMTAITDREEDQSCAGRPGPAWRLDVALKNNGGVFDDGHASWTAHVVVDRHLITGQNPASAHATAHALLTRLDAQSPSRPATADALLPGQPATPTSGTPTESVERFLDAFANRSVDAAMRLVAPRAVVVVHPLEVDGGGPDTLRQVLSDLLLSFPDLRVGVERIITTGNVVTALFTVGGTQSADYAGAASVNKHLRADHAWRFVVADSVVTDVSAYWCQAQVYRRLAVTRYDEIAVA